MGNDVFFFDVEHSEPNTVGKKTATKLTAEVVANKMKSLSTEIGESNIKSVTHKITGENSVFVLLAHRDKEANFATRWEKAKKHDVFPIVMLDRKHLQERYGPTFKHLCSFVLTYSDRHYS